ncbi:glycoside hydrolase family 36 protein, partial [Micromonospora azadirachtae]
YSTDGLAGLARVWHRYQRLLAGERLVPRPVLYNSWEATYFAVDAKSQLELAGIAADLGVETFVVDDGWFVGRDDDTAGLGDWTPDPAKFPDGFEAFIAEVRGLGLRFGLWVEPECVNPRSRLYAEHPDWVYQVDGRPLTPIRNQYLLDLGRPEVAEFVHSTLDGLLRRYDIAYLKWDFNRPRTEPGRAGADGPLDLDGAHVTALHGIYDRLRRDHPDVLIESCAGGGARTDLAMAGRADIFWPSDNTAPMDRLAIQHGFLHANAPHLLSSWVTDAPGIFDPRPRSLAFRFVLAMAGVLGIGADIRHWTPQQRAEAAGWISRYKEIREIVTHGEVHLIGGPDQARCAVQYTSPDGRRVVVLAWH